MAAKKLIIGLGNPGLSYQATRHNLGFMVIQALADEQKVSFRKSRHAQALTADVVLTTENVTLVMPMTFMNLSGQAVRDIAHFEKVAPENILVVSDDIHLDWHDIRLKSEGSAGGHNGLDSVIQELGTAAFWRLRMGIGKPPLQMDQAAFVLSGFLPREQGELTRFIGCAVECCRMWVAGESVRAMTVFNKRKDAKNNE